MHTHVKHVGLHFFDDFLFFFSAILMATHDMRVEAQTMTLPFYLFIYFYEINFS